MDERARVHRVGELGQQTAHVRVGLGAGHEPRRRRRAAPAVFAGVAHLVAGGAAGDERGVASGGRCAADVADGLHLAVGGTRGVGCRVGEEAVVGVRQPGVDHPDDLTLAVDALVPDRRRVVVARLDHGRGLDGIERGAEHGLDPPHVVELGDLFDGGRVAEHERDARDPPHRSLVTDSNVVCSDVVEHLDDTVGGSAVEQRRVEEELAGFDPLRGGQRRIADPARQLVLGQVGDDGPDQRIAPQASPGGIVDPFDVGEVGHVRRECQPVLLTHAGDVLGAECLDELDDARVGGIRAASRIGGIGTGVACTALRGRS